MNFKEHLTGGLAAGTVATGTLAAIPGHAASDPREYAFIFALIVAGSLAPDLDTHSKPSRYTAMAGAVFSAVSIYFKEYHYAAWAGLVFFIIKAQKHRGVTHSWLLPVLCVGVSLYMGNLFAAAFGGGLATHYVLDRISPLRG